MFFITDALAFVECMSEGEAQFSLIAFIAIYLLAAFTQPPTDKRKPGNKIAQLEQEVKAEKSRTAQWAIRAKDLEGDLTRLRDDHSRTLTDRDQGWNNLRVDWELECRDLTKRCVTNAAVAKNHEARANNLEVQLRSTQDELIGLRDDYERSAVDAAFLGNKRLVDLQKRYQTRETKLTHNINADRESHSQLTQSMRETYERSIQVMRDAHKQSIQELRERHEQDMCDSQASHDRLTVSMQEDYDQLSREMEAMRKDYERRLARRARRRPARAPAQGPVPAPPATPAAPDQVPLPDSRATTLAADEAPVPAPPAVPAAPDQVPLPDTPAITPAADEVPHPESPLLPAAQDEVTVPTSSAISASAEGLSPRPAPAMDGADVSGGEHRASTTELSVTEQPLTGQIGEAELMPTVPTASGEGHQQSSTTVPTPGAERPAPTDVQVGEGAPQQSQVVDDKTLEKNLLQALDIDSAEMNVDESPATVGSATEESTEQISACDHEGNIVMGGQAADIEHDSSQAHQPASDLEVTMAGSTIDGAPITPMRIFGSPESTSRSPPLPRGRARLITRVTGMQDFVEDLGPHCGDKRAAGPIPRDIIDGRKIGSPKTWPSNYAGHWIRHVTRVIDPRSQSRRGDPNVLAASTSAGPEPMLLDSPEPPAAPTGQLALPARPMILTPRSKTTVSIFIPKKSALKAKSPLSESVVSESVVSEPVASRPRVGVGVPLSQGAQTRTMPTLPADAEAASTRTAPPQPTRQVPRPPPTPSGANPPRNFVKPGGLQFTMSHKAPEAE